MKKVDLKLMIWGILSALAVFSAFLSTSFFMVSVFVLIAVFSMFLICLAGSPVMRVISAVFMFAGAYFSGGYQAVFASAVLILIPSFGMAFIIRYKRDYSFTLCGGTVLFCVGVMLVDRFMLEPVTGGLRVIFSSVIDSVEKLLLEVPVMQAYGDEEFFRSMFYGIKLMLPCLVVVFALGIMFVVLLVSRRFILNIPVPPFFALQAPRTIAYFYCFGYIFSGMASASSMWFEIILSNMLYVLSTVLMICGLSLLRFFTKRIQSKGLSMLVFVTTAPICCLYLPFILTTVGTVDAVFNFRRPRK